MRERLFDVILSNDGDPVTGEFWVGVTIIDRRASHDGEVVTPRTDFPALRSAIDFARNEITAFMERTPA